MNRRILIFLLGMGLASLAEARVKEAYLLGPINAQSLEQLQIDITALGLEPEEDELLIHLDSPGGDTTTSWNMIAFIRWISGHSIPVTMQVDFHCGSACIPVFAAGDRRRAHPKSIFYFHGPQLGGELSPDDYQQVHAQVVEKYVEHLKFADITFGSYVEKTGIAAEGETPMKAEAIDKIAPDFLELI